MINSNFDTGILSCKYFTTTEELHHEEQRIKITVVFLHHLLPNLHYIFIQNPQNYPATSEIYGCNTDIIHTPHNTVPACVLVAEMTS